MRFAETTFEEVESFLARWLARNEQIFQDEIDKRNIGDKNELRKSFHHEIHRLALGYLLGEHYFLTRGRFVDMGVGRGHGRGSITRSSGDSWSKGRKGRKSNPWYSRVFYARLNDLMGAVGAKVSEQAVKNIRRQFKTI